MAARQHGAAACAALARLCRYLEPARRQFSRQSVSGATSELQTSVMVDLVTTLLDTDAVSASLGRASSYQPRWERITWP